MLPSGFAAAEASSGTAAAGGMDAGDGLAVSTASSRVVLELGSHGALVTALQRRLNDVLPFTHIAVDGIYGPVTRGAVVNFQRQHNLDATGAVDVRTWASMFNAPVIVMNAANDAGSGAGTGGSGAATRTSISSVPASGNSLGGAATAGGTAGTAIARVTHAAEVLTSASAGVSATPAVASTGNAGTDASATGNTGSQTAGTQTAGARRGDTSTGTGSAGAGSDGTGTNASSGTGGSDASSLGGRRGSSSGGSSAGGSSAGGSGGPARSGSSGKATKPSVNSQSIAVVAPPKPSSTTQTLTYVLTNGVALPLPRQYITNGYVDQGVDYAAPGGTPEYAMGDGVIIGEGISGFGPNAPILQITSGPLKGLEVYYGHAGPNVVHVGQHVTAGQQITEVGYGIVGISTGPHLEVGFYPPGGMGAGSKMLAVINSLLSQHPTGRAWGTSSVGAASDVTHAVNVSLKRTVPVARTTRAHTSTSAGAGSSGGVSASPTTQASTASDSASSSAANGTSGQASAPASADPSASSAGAGRRVRERSCTCELRGVCGPLGELLSAR